MTFGWRVRSARPLLLAALLTAPVATGLAQEAPPAVPVKPVVEAPLDASAPEEIAGTAIALDGRTLLIGAAPVRLFGVGPVEESVLGGLKARLALETLLADKTLACRPVDRDRDGIVRAVCEAAGQDVAERLIAAGSGLPQRLDSYAGSAPAGLGARYDAAEATARDAGSGVWAGLKPPSPPAPRTDERPHWIPKWLWRLPVGPGALAGALLGFLGLAVAAILLSRARRPRG